MSQGPRFIHDAEYDTAEMLKHLHERLRRTWRHALALPRDVAAEQLRCLEDIERAIADALVQHRDREPQLRRVLEELTRRLDERAATPDE
ncbi:hypothetical protein [Deinococcus pimensis]|uniref:hypothetical protein n=1 Tax=Deinococcus pimensis TaxID=309888 RepID=UPI0004829292|nr:hypothetical protein [Deinococcus pimensis]